VYNYVLFKALIVGLFYFQRKRAIEEFFCFNDIT